MNDDQFDATESLARAWTVSPTDIRGRVAAAIGADPEADPTAQLLEELRAMRTEIKELRTATALLHQEILRLRQDRRPPTPRIAPYTAGDGLIRLS